MLARYTQPKRRVQRNRDAVVIPRRGTRSKMSRIELPGSCIHPDQHMRQALHGGRAFEKRARIVDPHIENRALDQRNLQPGQRLPRRLRDLGRSLRPMANVQISRAQWLRADGISAGE